jgi:hypothetical protein
MEDVSDCTIGTKLKLLTGIVREKKRKANKAAPTSTDSFNTDAECFGNHQQECVPIAEDYTATQY